MTSPLTQRWRQAFTQDPEVDAFVRSLQAPDMPIRILPDDEADFVQSLRQPSGLTLFSVDPRQREKEDVLAATFRLPMETVRMLEPVLSESLTAHAPDWLSQATASWKAGWGDVYVTGARSMEWLGLPASVFGPYRDFGLTLQKAFLPPMKPEEFTWRQLRNPEWFATSVARAVPFSLSLLPATIVGAYAGGASATAIGLGTFGRTVLMTLGGTALSRPIESAFEAGSTYDEAMRAGASPEEAEARADFVFMRNLGLAGMDAAELLLAFTPLKSVGRYLPNVMKRRVVSTLTRLAGVGALESGEEAFQTAIQQVARGEEVTWNAEMSESTAIGGVMGAGLGGAGSVYHGLTSMIETKMSSPLRAEYETLKRAAMAAGEDLEQAQLSALDAVAETPEGKQFMEQFAAELKERGEGKEAPTLTPEQVELEIGKSERTAEEEVQAAQTPLADEVFDAIAKEEASAEMVFGLETEAQAEGAAPPAKAEPTFFVSEERYQQAQTRLKDKLSGLHAGIDPTLLAELVTIGAYHVERGVKTFAEWSKVMVTQFGEKFRPQLRKVWNETQKYLAGTPPTGAVKGIIRLTTDQQSLAKLIREDVALSAAMRKAEQNARIAYREGKKEALEQAKAEFKDVLLKAQIKAEAMGVKAGYAWARKVTRQDLIIMFKDSQQSAKQTRQAIIGYINENLPRDLRGKFLNAVIQNLTKRKQESILRRVDRVKELLTKKELIAELGDLVSRDPKVALGYQRLLADLVRDLDMRRMTEATQRKLEGLKTYADEHGMPSGVSQKMLDALQRLNKRPAAELTVEELQELRDMAEHLKALGKVKLALKYKYDEHQRQKHLKRLLASTQTLDPAQSGKQTAKDKARKGLLFLYLEGLQAPRVAEMIDGYREGENVALAKKLSFVETFAQHEIHLSISAAIAEMADAGITHLDDDSNLRITLHIRQREGATAAVNTLMAKHGLEEMPELTPNEEKIIAILQKYTNANVNAIAALHEERTNTPFVRLQWYGLPLYYVGESMVSPEEVIQHSYRRTTQTAQGMVKERRLGVSREPRIDVLAMFEQAINEQQWYLQMQPELDSISRLVRTKEYVEAAGDLASNWWKSHLDIVARRGWSASATQTPFSRLLRFFRGNMTLAMLGYKLSTILIQPFAVIDAMAYAQGRWGTTAALRIAAEVTKSWIHPETRRATIEASLKLQRRAAGEVAVEEALRELGRGHGAWENFQRAGMALVVKADVITAAGVQTGVQKILEARGVPNALQEAEYIMQLVSSSADVSFRPHILAWGEGARTWLTFQTFLLNRWGIITHDLIAKGMHGNWKAKYSALLGLVIIAMGKIAEDEARNYLHQLLGRSAREPRSLAERALLAIPSNIPVFGDVFTAFSGRSEIPVMNVLGDVFKSIDVVRAKTPKAKARAALRGAEAAATLAFGVPGTAQGFDLIENIFVPGEKRRVTK